MSQISPIQSNLEKENCAIKSKQWAVRITDFKIKDELDDEIGKNSCKNLAYATLIPLYCITLTMGTTLIPQHDVFVRPEYWLDVCFPWISFLVPLTIEHFLRINIFFPDIEAMKAPKVYFKMFFLLSLC